MSVFTSVDTAQLNSFLENYPVDPLQSFKGIEAGITNSNYFIDTASRRLVLTIVEHESHADVEWFMQLLAYLHKSSIPCAKPIQSIITNQYAGTIADKPATLVECLDGSDKEEVTAANCYSLGVVLANLHVSCREYASERTDSMGAMWREQTADKVRAPLNPQQQKLLDRHMQANYAALLDNLPASVIHADLFRDNVLFTSDDNISGVIDFYYACNGCMLYDLAIAFNDWCREESTTIDPPRARALLNGYESVRPLESSEQAAWPEALSCAALRFWLSRLHDLHFPPEALMTYTKDPAPFEKILSSPAIAYVDIAT